VIDDPSVSSRHAQVELSGEVYRIKDLDSTNGTRVNGIPITETTLRFEDRIRFGGVDARFEADTRGTQPLPVFEEIEIEAKPAESSAAPVDFASASPFRAREKDRDPTRTVVLAAAGIALLTFLGSMIAVLFMHAPRP
jgi:pSer/pThr/pTyr-binding forkhead associated (FHA) protein